MLLYDSKYPCSTTLPLLFQCRHTSNFLSWLANSPSTSVFSPLRSYSVLQKLTHERIEAVLVSLTSPPLSTLLWSQEREDDCNLPSSPLLLKCTSNEASSLLLSLSACMPTAAHVWLICMHFLQSKEWWANFVRRDSKTYITVSLSNLLRTLRQNPELFPSFAFKKGITSRPPLKLLYSTYQVLKYHESMI